MSATGKSTTALVIGAIVAVLALVVLVGTLSSCGSSVKGYVKDHYSHVGKRNGAELYRSDKRVEKVVSEITDAWKPADRLTDPGGVFLRYSDTFVAVRPRSGGGTDIEIDDPERGYAHWYPFVGGWFGTYSGRAEGFRGGGPGSGK